jgi:cytochrome c-type biogenesis protein CcmH/NrfG
MDDALETCRLSTEVHPFNWHSWYNLAQIYKTLGNEQAKLAAYRCVNVVDPDNHNAVAIRELLAQKNAQQIPLTEGCPADTPK